MKITISMNEVLERLYAITALHGYVNDTGGGYVANILTPAQAPALRVTVRAAHNAAMSYLAFSGWRSDPDGGELAAVAPDTLVTDGPTATAVLSEAVTFLTLYIIYSTGADDRAGHVHEQAVASLRHLESERWHAARMTAHS